MSLALTEDAFGDQTNATFLALASELAYLADAPGAEAFRNQLGLEAKLFSVGNTQAFVGTNDDHVVVAFRGTESPTTIEGLKDWLLTDACNLLIVPEGQLGTDFAAAGVGARFHRGFMVALADIWDPVKQTVELELKKKDRPLWITGHSLGGALAVLAAWRFNRQFINVHQIYTYGGPMVGNAEASAAFDKAFPDKLFRYVNAPDVVPLLPTVSLIANDYKHCEKEMGLGAIAGAATNAFEFLKSFTSSAVDGLLKGSIADTFWQQVIARVAAHGMDQYRGLIGKLGKGE
jgi:triacylglycerol lipase